MMMESRVMFNQELEQSNAVIEALRGNGFKAQYADNIDGAVKRLLEMIPLNVTVGVSDSATIRQLGILGRLKERGTKVINPWTKGLTQAFGTDKNASKVFKDLMRETLCSDIYLASTNAITSDGKLVYIDAVGNRIAGVIYAVPRVIVIAGPNKIVVNVDTAIERIKNVISPEHAKRRQRKLPCAKTLKCVECNAQERQCNILAIIEKSPRFSDICVIIVGQDLGLGWDPIWAEDRINHIREAYYEASWVFPPPSFL